MSKEGSLGAPIRHPINFEHPDFLNPEKLDTEMRRVFDICHGCRRCFNLCDSFPKLFDMIDDSKNEDVESLSSDQFAPVVDACTLCDMCFMTKCPYVPPHDFDLDFPHLMLRYRTAQKKLGKLPNVPAQLFLQCRWYLHLNLCMMNIKLTGLSFRLIKLFLVLVKPQWMNYLSKLKNI